MPIFEGVTFLGKPTRVDAGTHNGARNKPNEDRFAAFTGPGDNGQPVQFMAVADGVTSTHGGERASDIAVRVLQQALQSPTQTAGRTGAKTLRDRLADAIHRANQEILETARKDPELKGMSTTLVVAAVDGNQLLLMHLGDSRAYLVRDGKPYQLTRDHTWVQEALEEGRITREQAANHPNKHVILRYLGDTRGISIDQGILDPDKPTMDIDETEVGRQQARAGDTSLTLRAGDALLLCSDGLYGRILDAEIAGAVTNYAAEKAVKSLIEEAVKRQEPDNITVTLWTTAGMVAPAAVAKATRRPALLLAAAGVLLAVLAFAVISMVSGSNQNHDAAQTASLATDQGVALAAETETPVTEAPTVEAPVVEPSVTGSLTETTPAETAPTVASDLPTTTPSAVMTETTGVTDTASTPSPSSTAVVGSETATPGSTASITAPDATLTAAAAAVATNVIPNLFTATPLPVSTQAPARPTSTPMATPTPRPSITPTATATRPLPTAGAPSTAPAGAIASPASDPAGGPTSAQIIQPNDNHSSNTPTIFKWVANTPLAPGQEFEVVFWRANGETETNARGLVHSSIETFATLPVGELAPDAYKWALYLVLPEPYRKLTRLAGPHTFTVPSSGGEPSNPSDPTPNPQPTTKAQQR